MRPSVGLADLYPTLEHQLLLEMAKPRRPPNVLAIKSLYGCCRSMTGPSVLTWYSKVSCRCLRHLYAPWWLFPPLFVRCRHRRSAVDVFSIPLTRRVCLRRLLWTMVLLSGVTPAGYQDTVQKCLSRPATRFRCLVL